MRLSLYNLILDLFLNLIYSLILNMYSKHGSCVTAPIVVYIKHFQANMVNTLILYNNSFILCASLQALLSYGRSANIL